MDTPKSQIHLRRVAKKLFIFLSACRLDKVGGRGTPNLWDTCEWLFIFALHGVSPWLLGFYSV